MLFAAFGSWHVPYCKPFATFWSWNFHFPASHLQHLGAGTSIYFYFYTICSIWELEPSMLQDICNILELELPYTSICSIWELEPSMLQAICNILELKLPFSMLFAAFGSWNLPCCKPFATFKSWNFHILLFSMLFAAFGSWNLPCCKTFATFWSWNFHFPCYLQHLGAGIFHVASHLQHFGAETSIFHAICSIFS